MDQAWVTQGDIRNVSQDQEILTSLTGCSLFFFYKFIHISLPLLTYPGESNHQIHPISIFDNGVEDGHETDWNLTCEYMLCI